MNSKDRDDRNDIVITFVQRAVTLLIDELPDTQKKTLRVHLDKPIGQIAEAITADYKLLADHLVSDMQICNKCGNEVHFDRYAVYPQARIDLPKNFGEPRISEQVWQFDPQEED